MTDLTLLLVGSGVFSLFFAGCYVAARENIAASPQAKREFEQERSIDDQNKVLNFNSADLPGHP